MYIFVLICLVNFHICSAGQIFLKSVLSYVLIVIHCQVMEETIEGFVDLTIPAASRLLPNELLIKILGCYISDTSVLPCITQLACVCNKFYSVRKPYTIDLNKPTLH